MVTFTVGSVVLIPFPFSDLSRSKLRPAVVIAEVDHGDWILCQVTSQPYSDSQAIEIFDESFQRAPSDSIVGGYGPVRIPARASGESEDFIFLITHRIGVCVGMFGTIGVPEGVFFTPVADAFRLGGF